jgi:hypothetical protein
MRTWVGWNFRKGHQNGQDRPQRRDHRLRLGNSLTSSTRTRFSAHTIVVYDATILPNDENPRRMEFSNSTRYCPHSAGAPPVASTPAPGRGAIGKPDHLADGTNTRCWKRAVARQDSVEDLALAFAGYEERNDGA